VSIELKRSPTDSFDLRGGTWSFLLCLAEAYGWGPAGTTLPSKSRRSRKWEGGYASSDGQQVNADDAAALAHALEKAVADRGYARRARVVNDNLNRESREAASRELGEDIPPEEWDEDYRVDKAFLKTAAAFCRRGLFKIR
jgi:hypothetical protein